MKNKESNELSRIYFTLRIILRSIITFFLFHNNDIYETGMLGHWLDFNIFIYYFIFQSLKSLLLHLILQ